MVLISTDYTTLLRVTNITFPGGILELPDSVKIIGAHAFKGCNDFLSIEIPDTVTEIGPWAFLVEFTHPEYPVLSRNKAA